MANVFEDMMSASQQQTTKGSGGRPMHSSWNGFERVDLNGKKAAKCLKYSKVFTNTHQKRMDAHR